MLVSLISVVLIPAQAFAIEQQTSEPDTNIATNITTDIEPIVVTIKPLYSLVSQLTEGIQTPQLLIKHPPSSHHYNLRPSERQLLARAKLIIWIGPAMESYLTKIIRQQENPSNGNIPVISAMQAKELQKLNKRTEYPQKNIEHGTQKQIKSHSEKRLNTDPHIWLSTKNAIAISKHIARQLITYDPVNTALYENNLQQLLTRIKHTDQFIKTTLNKDSSTKQQAFITYHDAFQYFENENQLKHIDSISYNEETGPSLKHLRRITELINEENINCLIYQPPRPALVNSLSSKAHIQSTALDPMGLDISDSKNAWFIIMQQLATGFRQCLNYR